MELTPGRMQVVVELFCCRDTLHSGNNIEHIGNNIELAPGGVRNIAEAEIGVEPFNKVWK